MANTISSRSQSARQKQLLNSGFIDLLGDNTARNEVATLDQVTESLYYLGAKFVGIAQKNLDAADRESSGFLAESIVAMPVQILGKVYTLPISVADYYDFVNKGVKGWADENGGNSPYQFKHYTGKSGQKNSKMVTAIRKWLIREGLQGMGKENNHSKASIRSQKRHSITDTSTKTAIIVSRSIRKKGIKPSHFWDKTIQDMQPIIKDEFAAAIKIDIINSIYGTK